MYMIKNPRSFIDVCENTVNYDDAIKFMSLIPDNSIPLIVTDPPYNSKIEWDKKNNEWQFLWLEQAKRVLKYGGAMYMFFAPLNMYGVEGYIRSIFNLRNILIWHHRNLYGAKIGFGKDRYKSTYEVVFYAIKGKSKKNVNQRAYRFGSGFDVIIVPQPRPLLHKAQKPLKIVEKFIYCSSDENDIVLDPFCGSGTTLIAAKKLRRRYIGVDNDLKSVEISLKRLDRTVLTFNLLGDIK